MRTFTIAAALIATAFAGFATNPAFANGGDGPSCAYGTHWDNHNYTCVSDRARSSASRQQG